MNYRDIFIEIFLISFNFKYKIVYCTHTCQACGSIICSIAHTLYERIYFFLILNHLLINLFLFKICIFTNPSILLLFKNIN